MSVAPGWYKDPADPTTQRYWDGEGWLGDPLPVDATPPPGPPKVKAPSPPPTPPPTVPPKPAPATASVSTPPRAQPTYPVWPPTAPPTPPGTTPPGVGWPPSTPPPSTPPPSTPPPSTPPPSTPPPGTPPTAPPPGLGGPGHPQAPQQQQPPQPPPGWPAGLPYPYPPGAPPPRPHGLRLAAPRTRLLARSIDFLLILGLSVIANSYFGYQWWQAVGPTFRELYNRFKVGDLNFEGIPPVPNRASTLELAMLFVAVALWFAYEVPAIANRGQTLGKRMTRIKVVALESTEPIGFRRAWRRWNPLGLPTLLWCCGFGFVLQFVDCLFVLIDRPLHQAIHDKSAATVVVDVHSAPDGGKP